MNEIYQSSKNKISSRCDDWTRTCISCVSAAWLRLVFVIGDVECKSTI